MIFVSELTGKQYKTAEECQKADEEIAAIRKAKAEEAEKKNEQRKARAAEVEEAIKFAAEAAQERDKLIRDFCKDYGSFHYSFKDGESAKSMGIDSLFDSLFKFL